MRGRNPSAAPGLEDGQGRAAEGLAGDYALAARRQVLQEIDDRGILATPANSFVNELVTEAARLSIARNGLPAMIEYRESPSLSSSKFQAVQAT